LDPPAEDDPILRSEGSGWEYTNREVYIETSRIALMAAVLWFFFATSNMRNHPKIAAFLFWYPWLQSLFDLLFMLAMDSF